MSLEFLSISQLSEVTGKDRRTISKRLANLQSQVGPKNAQLYKASEAIELLLTPENAKGLERKLQQAELDEKRARAEKVQIEVARMRGELVSLEDVAKVVEKEYSIIRAQVRAIPSKMAKPLSMTSDPNEVHNKLAEVIDECLKELTADEAYEQSLRDVESNRGPAIPMQTEDTQASTTVEPGGMGGSVSVPES